MATDFESACDAILGVLKAQWDLQSPAVVGSADPVKLVYEETERSLKPHPADTQAPWARVVVRHSTGRSAALGNRRFRRTGTVYVQCFVPNDDGLAKGKSAKLAGIAQEAYERSRSPVVGFKDVSLQEKGQDGVFYRTDVVATFSWDEIRS